jgi:hypothetical protein
VKGMDLTTRVWRILKRVCPPLCNPLVIAKSPQGFNSSKKSLFALACTLAAWLHLVCGLSRSMTTQFMKILEIIVLMAINLGCHAEASESWTSSDVKLTLPHDVRTAMSALSIEPKIIRSICCPKCYAKYALDSLPQICFRRETPRSKPCGGTLWTSRSTRGGPCLVPQRLYSCL